VFACEAVDLGFLNTAPSVLLPPFEWGARRARCSRRLHTTRPTGRVFPGFDTTGRYHTSAPQGVGSRCTKRVVGIKVDETVLAWDEGERFAFRVDSRPHRHFRPGLRTTTLSRTA